METTPSNLPTSATPPCLPFLGTLVVVLIHCHLSFSVNPCQSDFSPLLALKTVLLKFTKKLHDLNSITQLNIPTPQTPSLCFQDIILFWFLSYLSGHSFSVSFAWFLLLSN